jgi:hypothetical protein
MKMLLKIFKEIGRGCHTLATGVAAGVVFSVSYLIANGFKCLTNNISAKVSVNLANVNYTEIIQAIESHSGNVQLPIYFQLADTNVAECTTPLIYGAAIGLGASAIYLTVQYAQQCAKRRGRAHRAINDEETPFLRTNQSLCC